MHILHVISGLEPAYGGPAQAIVGLAAAQRRLVEDVHVISTARGEIDRTYIDQLERAGVTVETIGPAKGKLCSHPQLASAVERAVRAADVVHIHAIWEQIQHDAAVASRRHRKPHIFRPCGMLDPWCLAQSRFKKQLYMAWRLRRNLNRATLLHFTSATEHELVQPLRLKPPAIVEANGVNLTEFAELPPPGTFKCRYPQLAGRTLVLFMSRLHRKKGLELLVPAFAQADVDDAVLVLAGPDDGGYRKEVEAMVDEHGLRDRVILPGMLKGEQRIAALADADLFVLPSYQENFGISVVEALAAGTPVVISDQVNIHGEISKGQVGGVVPTQVGPLADALTQWLADAAMREAAAARSRSFVQQRYDWDQIATRWLTRYESLAKGSLPDDAIASSASTVRRRPPA